jgi:hypothetical protein
MPNQRLSQADVETLLQYLAEASADAPTGKPVATAAAPAAAPAKLAAPLLAAVRESLAAYEKTRESLAADDLAAAQTNAAVVLTTSARAAKMALAAETQRVLQEVAASANGIQKAPDIDEARRMFGELSQRVVALLVREPVLRTGRSLFMCPMAPGYKKWVQTSRKLENPYMGKRMPHCGMPVPEWTDAAS